MRRANTYQVILIPCSLLFVVSVMLTSLCTEYYQFILAQGVLGGICNGLTYTPALTAVNQYFFHRRPLALGIASSGSSLAGVIFPVALDRMLNHTGLGFGWSVRILGFLMLAMSIVACMTITSNAPRRKTGAPLTFEAWSRPAYTWQILGLFLVFWAMFFPFFYIPSYAQSVGVGISLSNYLIAILNAGSLVGRLLGGALANRLGRFNTVVGASLICGILTFCWLAISSSGGMIAFSLLYGLFSGVVIGLFAATIAMTAPQPNVIGSYIGMALGVGSLASLTGTPITGAMISRYGSFSEAMIFGGVCGVVGAVMIFVARQSHSRAAIA
jgi:predicted MFS family arabinose efflux permease